MLEWLVAQELFRRLCIRDGETPESLPYWSSKDRKIDFAADLGSEVRSEDRSYIEVKRGETSPLEYAWFLKVFPDSHLTVISASRFETDRITGVTMADFLTST